MTRRGFFLADGSSDLPIARHLETLCDAFGADVSVTPVDHRLLPDSDRTVEGRLRSLVRQLQGEPDLVFVHRDAESQPASLRREEIAAAQEALGLSCPVVPVVPRRMTEAWLLLDESAIRTVAEHPNGRRPLRLPTPREAERMADPKSRLKELLLEASEVSGTRRTRDFTNAFGRHRSLLIQRLDSSGRVNELEAWQQLLNDVQAAVTA